MLGFAVAGQIGTMEGVAFIVVGLGPLQGYKCEAVCPYLPYSIRPNACTQAATITQVDTGDVVQRL